MNQYFGISATYKKKKKIESKIIHIKSIIIFLANFC